MKCLSAIFFFTLTITNAVFAQNNDIKNKRYFLKVRIDNFNSKGPDCGVMLFNSVYKVEIMKPSPLLSNEALLYVGCREAYGMNISDSGIYKIECFIEYSTNEPSGMLNFSGVEPKDFYKKYKLRLISIKPAKVDDFIFNPK